MADIGEKATEREFKRLKAKIKDVYQQAYEDIYKKNLEFVKRQEKKEAQYRQMLAEGKISQADFDAWMRGQIFQGQQWEAKRKQMQETLLNADRIARQMINDSRYSVFADNANFIGYELEKGAGVMTSFGLYDANSVRRLLMEEPDLLPPRKIPGRDESYKWYNRQIQTAITQGIIQGEDIRKIAKRVARQTGEANMKAALRNARTMHTGAQNAGRIEGMHQAQRLGIKVQKQWMATLDGRTRDSHRDLDGQIQDVDKPFKSAMGKIMYPGDPAAHPGNVWNCFIGETQVASDSEIVRSYKHDYTGELITVETARGIKFTCTPNHPILTMSGWVGANGLHKGDNLLIASLRDSEVTPGNPDINHVFPRMDALHELWKELFVERAAGLSVNFHGDVATANVEIVSKERFLMDGGNASLSKTNKELKLKHTAATILAECHFVPRLRRVHISALRFMRRAGKPLPLLGRSLSHAIKHGFRTVPWSDAAVLEPERNGVASDMQFLGQGLDGFPGQILVDNVVNIKVTTVSHVPVFNLQTRNGYYFVNDIIAQSGVKGNGIFVIAHNCRCTLVTVYPEYPDEMMKRRDNETKEIIENMTYREWEAMKQGEGEAPEPEKPKIRIPEFEPAKTRTEAEEYAGRFADSVSYNGLSVDNCNAINRQLNELTTKYPITKLDAIEQKRISAVMSASAKRLNIDGKKLGSVLNTALEDFKKSQEYARQQIENIKARFAGKAKMPFSAQSTIDKLSEKLKFKRYGVHEIYEDHVMCTVAHEYGHILSDQYFGMINKDRGNPNYNTNWGLAGRARQWDEVFRRARETGDIYGISEYANRNSHEFFAECFAAREMGEKLPDYVESLMKETLENGVM